MNNALGFKTASYLVDYLSNPSLRDKPVFVSIAGELQTLSGCKVNSDSEMELRLNEPEAIDSSSLSVSDFLLALRKEISMAGTSELKITFKNSNCTPSIYPSLCLNDRVLVLSTEQGL